MSNAAEYEKLSEPELRDALFAFQFRTLGLARMLSERCGDPIEASRHIRLALDLPATVVTRQTHHALSAVDTHGEPTVAEIAALIARMTATVRMIEETLARKQAAVTLQ